MLLRRTLTVLIGVVSCVAVVAGCGSSERVSSRGPSGTTISGYGLTIELPPGWHGRIYRRSPQYAIMLDAATVPLPPAGDDLFDQTALRMGTDDLYLHLDDIGRAPHLPMREPVWKIAEPPLELQRSDLGTFPVRFAAFAERPVVVRRRLIQLDAGFGSPPADRMLARLNAVLGTLNFTTGEPSLRMKFPNSLPTEVAHSRLFRALSII
jgi:hypothetical protein